MDDNSERFWRGVEAIYGGEMTQATAALREEVRHLEERRGAMLAEIDRLTEALARETATRLDYERCISFEVSCRECARLLDLLHAADARAEKAEASLRTAQPEIMARECGEMADVIEALPLPEVTR